MPFQTSHEGSKFIVDFGSLPVPSAMATELEGEFQRLALAMLARIDFRGDIRINHLPPGLYGYVFEPNGFPFPDNGQEQLQLSVHDHTNIVRTLMEQPFPVARQFITKREQGEGKPPKPPWDEVLESILKLLAPPVSTRRAIETTLRVGKTILSEPLPRPAKTAVEKLNKQIDGANDIDDLIEILKKAQRADEGALEGLTTGLRIAQQIVEDGRDTIYNPGFGFYRDFDDPPLVAYGVVKADVKGAVQGAIVGASTGFLTAGATTAPGAATVAVIGGAGSSAAEVVSQVIDWIFG